MTDQNIPPPYKTLFGLWAKMQLGVGFAFAIMFLGSFALAPEWAIGKRIGVSLLLPIMLEILCTAVCLGFAVKVWRVHRLANKNGSGSGPD